MDSDLHCGQVAVEYGIEQTCCDDCHDEHEYGYGELSEWTMPDGRRAWVCCKMEEALDGLKTDG